MTNIIEVNGKKYVKVSETMIAEVAYFDDNGEPVLKAQTTTKIDGYDEHGNPKRSVEIRVPCAIIGAQVGNNG